MTTLADPGTPTVPGPEAVPGRDRRPVAPTAGGARGRGRAPGERAQRGPRRRVERRRWEPWRDWLGIAVFTHTVLVATALLHLGGVMLAVAALPLGAAFGIGTLTVLHDAGHRMFSQRLWPNALAVQISTPGGLWAGHWTLKHRNHHKQSQVYPVDESTRSSSFLRLHPAAPRKGGQRHQHVYAWALYGLAWVGELRSQLRFVRTGEIAPGVTASTRGSRLLSFAAEKAVCVVVLAPYAWVLGVGRLAMLLVFAETVASVFAATILVVGHINAELEPTDDTEAPWARNLMLSTASFSTGSTLMRHLTGGMTHHVAHHLRPTAVRSDLPRLHATVVQDMARRTGVPAREFPTLWRAICGHGRRLRELGAGPHGG